MLAQIVHFGSNRQLCATNLQQLALALVGEWREALSSFLQSSTLYCKVWVQPSLLQPKGLEPPIFTILSRVLLHVISTSILLQHTLVVPYLLGNVSEVEKEPPKG